MAGKNNRAPWRPYYQPYGPIGLLLVQLNEKAAAVSEGFEVHAFGWPTFNALTCSYAELRPHATRLAHNARTRASQYSRKSTQKLYAVDKGATNASLRKFQADEKASCV